MSANQQASNDGGTEIAVIGMSGVFPGARTVAEFWRNLCDGVESVSFFSDEELRVAGVSEEMLTNPNYVRARAIIADIALFDAGFFGLSAREAELMDPQQRLFLECTWSAIEDAGYNPLATNCHVGVFGSCSLSTYLMHNVFLHCSTVDSTAVTRIMLGNNRDFLTTQVSYRLNLTGPSVAVQCACSSSLIALHMACQSLLSGECDMALAGGVSIVVPQTIGYLYQEGGIYSPDGHVRVFDRHARGTVGGDGAGIVVLRRLADALADGDPVRAVIKGSAINNDGAAKAGYAAPSVEGQVRVVRDAHLVAEVDPESIGYVEAHGTGTALGDPIEIAALSDAFGASTSKRQFCAVGSLKANIGHVESAAGIAGFIKVVLMLQHRLLPPSINFEQPNPQIDFKGSPFYVNTRLSKWAAQGTTPRRAAVSAFGIGGTNGHIVLEEAPPGAEPSPGRPWQLLVLSAKTRSALDQGTVALGRSLRQDRDVTLADAAYTLQVGREGFHHRRMLLAGGGDPDAAASALESFDQHRLVTGTVEDFSGRIVFLFPGQGAQYPGMGGELYRHERPFRENLDRCCELLRRHLEIDLRDAIFDTADSAADERLAQTAIAQPALFAVEYALAQLWMSWGVRPQSMLGHSIGEYVAACLAGVFSLEDGLRLVAARGRLMQQMPAGGMLAVRAPKHEVAPLLEDGISLSAINGPELLVLGGPKAAIARAERWLTERGLAHHRLHTSHAFHSALCEPAAALFADEVSRVRLNAPSIPYLSNVTGGWITPESATDPAYWASHLRHTVEFSPALELLMEAAPSIFLEVGPGQTLSTLVLQYQRRGGEHLVLSSMGRAGQRKPEQEILLWSLGHLWLRGGHVDWKAFHADERRRRVPLPTYAFDRQRYWIDPPEAEGNEKPMRGRKRGELTGKRVDVADWFWRPDWHRTLPLASTPAIEEGCQLVFAEETGIGLAMTRRLAVCPGSAATVMSGARFSDSGTGTYTVRPVSTEDYVVLFRTLWAAGRFPSTIFHCWNVTPRSPEESGRAYFERMQQRGFYSLLAMAKALHEIDFKDAIDLVVVSNRLHDVSGDEGLTPEKATLLGVCKSIAQEQPGITVRSIDIVAPVAGSLQEQLMIDRLLAEALHRPPETVVAYRGRQRWVQSFEPFRLEACSGASSGWRRNGVYLIAGGLGRVGLLIGAHLARSVQAKLVLLSRFGLPPRSAWAEWIGTNEEADPTRRGIEAVLAMEASGAEVMVASANVTDESAMRRVLRSVDERFGILHGIIYAAAARRAPAADSLLVTLDPDSAAAEFRPKVDGLYVLDHLLRGRSLDVCLLCSSIASVLGGIGLAAYAAANLFMDSYCAAAQGMQATPWVSVNWDIWPPEAGEGKTLQTSIDRYAMTEAEALDTLDRIVSALPSGQVVVSTGDLVMRGNVWLKAVGDRGAARGVAHPRPDLHTEYAAPRNETEMLVARTWEELLGFGPLGIYDNFFELGGHSLIAGQVVSKLCVELQVDLPLRCLFEGPTIAELALAVLRHRAREVDDMTLEGLLADLQSHAGGQEARGSSEVL